MDDALFNLISSAAPITAIVGGKIFWGMAQQGAAPPYLTLNIIGNQDRPHMQGAGGYSRFRVQIDSYGTNRPAARALSNLVKAQLNGTRSGGIRLILFETEREDQESSTVGRPSRFSQDYFVTWRPEHG